MAFHTAIYTDVTRDESVDGEDGFNFQAISEGITGRERQAIRERMLHRISGQWPVERDEREHPPSCAFAVIDDGYYFSRGISTGTTNNGRRGNQLTQAAVTGAADDLQPHRPAQLYGAKHWALEKADGTVCEPWFAPLELDPAFEAEALLSALRNDPWMLQTLPAFLSMITDALAAHPKKTVLVHDDLDTVMRWIATGTLLISNSDALRLEYRAFVADPFRAQGHIIGTHPDLLQGSLAGAHVINLLDRTVTDIDLTPLSRKAAEWVSDLDAFDALEIIEIAQRWEPHLGAELAVSSAELVTGARATSSSREEWKLGVRIVEALAAAGLTDDLEIYVDELGDAVSMHQLSGEEDFRAAARAARFTMGAGLETLAEAVVLPTLSSLAEDTELQWSGIWARELSHSGDWVWPATAEPEQFTAPLTELLLRAPDEALPALFQVAQPLAATLSTQQLRPALDRAVDLIMRTPAVAAAGVGSWYEAAAIERGLMKSLVAASEHNDPGISGRYRRQLQEGTWDFLNPEAAGTLVPAAVQFESLRRAAQIARVPATERAEFIAGTPRLPGPENWRFALTGLTLPEHIAAFAIWIERVGITDSLDAVVFASLSPFLAQEPRNVKRRDAEAWEPLVEALQGTVPPQPHYQESGQRLTQFIADIPTARERAKEKSDAFMSIFKNRKED